MHKKGKEKPEEGSKLSSKSVNGLRQKVQKTGIFELFWPLMSIWRMRNELHKYKQILRYQGSRVAVNMRTRYTAPKLKEVG